MNTQNMSTITKLKITKLKTGAALLAILALAFLPTIVLAHGGEEHVIGTVTNISDTSVTVKTTAGKAMTVGFDAKTTFARADQPMPKADIKVGDRVVIHAVEVNEKLVAHTVEIGGATKQAVKH